MPNHVDQDLVITGDATSIKEFLFFAADGKVALSHHNFLPYPEEYAKLDKQAEEERAKGNYFFKDGFNSGGYEWCLKNWGTKWGIYDSILKRVNIGTKNGKLFYKFQSAWSPPLPVIEAMSKKFPTLTFDLKYYERGVQFKGNYQVLNGETLLSTRDTYKGRRGG